MRVVKGVVSLIIGLALSVPALAASLTSVTGTVLVNRGGGYQTVRGPMELNPGDVLVVDPGGSAQLSYPDGCSVQVQVGTIVTIGEQSPCATQAGTGEGLGGTAPFIISAGVTAGVVGLILSKDKNDKPASP